MTKKSKNKSPNLITWFSIGMAILLIIILCFLIKNQMEEYHLQNDPILNNLRVKFTEFFDAKRQWPQNLNMLNNKPNPMHEINLYKGKKSYTINKEKVYLCLRDEHGNYYNENMLTYVLAHELAHVLCKSVGHTEEFYRIFDTLLNELTKANVYDSTQEILADYCEHGDNS